MSVTFQEMAELTAYQLKDACEVLYEKWKDGRLINDGRVLAGDFKTTFVYRFFPLELWERNKIQ